jgi:formylglycine-generating enzyme required for sulfatase activity
MRVFINYAHADLNAVEQIAAFLHSESHDISSEEQLLPEHDWAAKLGEQLDSADAVVYAISPDSLAAEWCQWALGQAIQKGKPIIPALLRESASLPDGLSALPYIDVAGGMSEEDKIALRNALGSLDSYKVTQDQSVSYPERPNGIPAQAIGTIDINRATSPRRTLLPNLLNLLPPPFEWLDIPAGEVTLKDASADGGSKGGTFKIGAFAIGKYAITNAQYRVFLEDGKGYANARWWDFSEAAKSWRQANATPPSVSPDAEKAVVGISWFEAVAFCRWMNVKVRPGLAMANRDMPGHVQPRETLPTVALPTEQQWQHAVENDGELMDLSGNVLEWCMNNWGTDQVVLGGDVERVVRVGSLEHDEVTRLSHRDLAQPDARNTEFGFRVVCYLPAVTE